MKARFEPASRKHRYLAELQTRAKQPGESWADFADDLKQLADKAYPDLDDKAREQLALTRYLTQLDHPQVAFGVKQANPTDLDSAVSSTLELEAYAGHKPNVPVLGVDTGSDSEAGDMVGAVGRRDELTDLIKGLTLRLDKLELAKDQGRGGGQSSGYRSNKGSRQRQITCFTCGQKGHIARNCQQASVQQSYVYPPQPYPQQPYTPQPPHQPWISPQSYPVRQQQMPPQPQGNGKPPV